MKLSQRSRRSYGSSRCVIVLSQFYLAMKHALAECPTSAQDVLRFFPRVIGLLCELTACTRRSYHKRGECSVTSQRTPKGLCANKINLSLRVYCVYVRNFGLPTELLCRFWSPYNAVTATPYRFFYVCIRTKSHGPYFVHAQ